MPIESVDPSAAIAQPLPQAPEPPPDAASRGGAPASGQVQQSPDTGTQVAATGQIQATPSQDQGGRVYLSDESTGQNVNLLV